MPALEVDDNGRGWLQSVSNDADPPLAFALFNPGAEHVSTCS